MSNDSRIPVGAFWDSDRADELGYVADLRRVASPDRPWVLERLAVAEAAASVDDSEVASAIRAARAAQRAMWAAIDARHAAYVAASKAHTRLLGAQDRDALKAELDAIIEKTAAIAAAEEQERRDVEARVEARLKQKPKPSAADLDAIEWGWRKFKHANWIALEKNASAKRALADLHTMHVSDVWAIVEAVQSHVDAVAEATRAYHAAVERMHAARQRFAERREAAVRSARAA